MHGLRQLLDCTDLLQDTRELFGVERVSRRASDERLANLGLKLTLFEHGF